MRRENTLGLSYEQFVDSLKKSQTSVEFISSYLKDKGYETEVPELCITPDEESRHSYSDETDLYYFKNNKKISVEVKQWSFNFTNTSIHYKQIIVDSITGYRSKKVKPDVYFILSKDKSYAIIIKGSTFDKWILKQAFDKVKKKMLWFYFIDKALVNIIKLKFNKNE